MARALVAATITLAAITLPAHRAGAEVLFADCTGHPRNPDGYVTDGSPQCGDQWCSGSTDQRAACYLARRTNCAGREMSKTDAMGCWAEITDLYPWDHNEAFQVLFCESRGKSNAQNGGHDGLMQEQGGPFDPAANIRTAFYDYWQPRGWQPWSTAGQVCN